MKSHCRIALAVAMLALAVPAGVANAEQAAGPADRMIDKMNDVRAQHGLRALRKAPKLATSSNDFAGHLIRTDSFGHGSSYFAAGFRRSGEIIAIHRGWSRRPSPVLRQWLRSSVHRELILDRSFRYVGTGPARGYFGGAPTTIWVAHFGAH